LTQVIALAIIRTVAKVAPEIKERLVGNGTWDDFNLFRRDEQKRGQTAAAAMRLAVAKYCPDLAGLPPASHRKGSKDARHVVPRNGGSLAAGSPAGGATAFPGDYNMTVDASVFEGKSCSMVTAIDWVIDALAVDPKDVRPETAPAAKAWSIYLLCRKSPSFAGDIISKAVVRQIPNGQRDDDGGGEAFDGQREYDLLGKIKAVAEGGS